jgi:glyoxylase-like metal-dependent hydrolase (beta-lactamase superfamily II)
MNALEMETHRVAPDVTALHVTFPVPGFGILPIRAHVLHAAEPVLVDTGLAAMETDFMKALRAAIDPKDLRWIWLTHTDADHIGNLGAVLREAPEATVVTTFIGMAKMGLLQMDVPRMRLLNPGQVLNAGDRELLAVSPPTFDAPETTGFLDRKTGALFSADSFGALLDAPALDAADIDPGKLRDGMTTWATIDAPWLRWTDSGRFGAMLDAVGALDPSVVLSSHLPPARGMTATLLGNVAAAPDAPAFVGPDQAALERMMSAV